MYPQLGMKLNNFTSFGITVCRYYIQYNQENDIHVLQTPVRLSFPIHSYHFYFQQTQT